MVTRPAFYDMNWVEKLRCVKEPKGIRNHVEQKKNSFDPHKLGRGFVASGGRRIVAG
jgi:hypothetical protein